MACGPTAANGGDARALADDAEVTGDFVFSFDNGERITLTVTVVGHQVAELPVVPPEEPAPQPQAPVPNRLDLGADNDGDGDVDNDDGVIAVTVDFGGRTLSGFAVPADAGVDLFNQPDGTADGDYGSLSRVNGVWTYTANAAARALADDAEVTDDFVFSFDNGERITLTVTVVGHQAPAVPDPVDRPLERKSVAEC